MLRMTPHAVLAIAVVMTGAACRAEPVPANNASRQPEATSGDWPCFRGPDTMGTSTATDLPLEWDATTNIAWKTALPGSGASSPITMHDHIYLTCYSGYSPGGSGSLEQLKRHVVALRRDTGEIVWDQAISARLPEEGSIRDHGYAANTPAADSEKVVAFLGKNGVFAFDHSGKQLWQADVGLNTHGWGTAASPLLYQDLVIINASVESDSLIALDIQSGRERWRAGGINEAWNTPIIITAPSGREELVVATRGRVLGFDPRNGKQLWSCDTDISWYMVPSGVAADGVIYYLGGRSGTAGLAIRAGGTGDVTRSHRLWTSQNGSNVTSPIYLDGHIYWMSEKLGIAFCAQAASGEVVYRERLNRAGQVYASPILAAGRLYYLTRSGRCFVIAASREFELLATNDLEDGSRFDASPAVDANRLLIRSEKFLYCVGE